MSLINTPMAETSSQRERPIAFAAGMIRALLDGRKTRTRRVISPQPRTAAGVKLPSRFGVIGDYLWVRERWGYLDQFTDPRTSACGEIVYAADASAGQLRGRTWRQSQFMPRSASRIPLRINQV